MGSPTGGGKSGGSSSVKKADKRQFTLAPF